MADMNKIINDIMLEAKDEAAKIIAQAEADAKELIASAEKECAAIENEQETRRRAEILRLEKRLTSSRAAQQRTELLKAKRDILNEAVDEAYREITALSGDEYENILIKLFKSRMRGGECTIYFPSGYEPTERLRDDLAELAKEKNCTYKISESGKIEDGFIMVYGGIEEHCDFKSLFEEKRDEIFELAAAELLGTEDSV